MTLASDLVTQIRFLTNMEKSQFVTDNQLLYYINASAGELDDILVSKQEEYRLTQTQLQITSGNLIPLPSDFYQLRQVDFYYSPSATQPWTTIQKYMLKEQTLYSSSLARSIYGVPNVRYMLQDGYIAIVPETNALGLYRVWYTPVFQQLALTDTIPSYFDNQAWREYIVVDCCIKVYNGQNLDPSIFMAQKAALKIRIEAMSGKRDSGSPKHIVNTRNSGEYGNIGFGGGGFFF
jgi:hypothetical protein